MEIKRDYYLNQLISSKGNGMIKVITVNHGLILYKRGCGYFFGLILIII